MPVFVNNHDAIYYEEAGSGEPLLLINGYCRTVRHWLGFNQELAKNFHVIALDNRGVGRSRGCKVPWDLTIEQMADDVAELIRYFGIGPAHIAGLSMGGMIAMAFAVRHPDLTKTLTVANSTVAGQGLRQVSGPALAQLGALLRDLKNFNAIVGPYLINAADQDAFRVVLEHWQACDLREPLSIAIALKQFLAIKRFRPGGLLSKITAPTLILKGSADAFVPQENSDRLHQLIPHSVLQTIAGGGHEMTVDHPQEVAAAINAFIHAVSAKRRRAA